MKGTPLDVLWTVFEIHKVSTSLFDLVVRSFLFSIKRSLFSHFLLLTL
jgi:hypothetical protein